MNQFFRVVLLMAVGLGVITIVSACTGDENTDGNAGEDIQTSQNENDDTNGSGTSGQVLNLTKKQKIATMDPSLAVDEVANQFISMTTEGLYRLDESGNKVPGIAKDEDISEDGKTWTFHLRDDAKWENGDFVTANDFVYAWRRAIDPETGSEYGPYLMNGVVENAEAISNNDKAVNELGVGAKDDKTLVVTLEKAVPYFDSLISFGIFNWPLNEDYVEEVGEDYGTSSEQLLSNGPYKIIDWENTLDSWKLEKNEDYWDADEITIDKLNYNVTKDSQMVVDLYEKGDIDRATLSSDLVDQYRSDDDFVTTPEASVFYLKLNQERTEALGNKNIRKAIGRAFDKEALVNSILNNGSIATDGLIPEKFSTHPDNDEDFRNINGDLVTYNVDKAQAYWEKGLEELGKDSVELEYLSGDGSDSDDIAEYMANQLEKNLPGLSISIQQVPGKQLTQLDKSMDYDLQFTGWAPDYQDPFTFLGMWITDENTNKMGYSVEKYDALLAETQNDLATKPAKRYNALLEAEKILLQEEAAIAPVYQTAKAKLVSPKIKGVITNAVGPEYEYKWAEIDEND